MRGALVVGMVVACAAPRAPSTPPPKQGGLGLAVWRGDLAGVRELLAHGADPDAKDDTGRPAVAWAVLSRDRAMTELVLAHARHVTDKLPSRMLLRIAAGLDEAWLVDALIARGVGIDGAEDHRASPLMVAAENGAIETMQHLIARGAAVNFQDPEGDTPLAAAVRAGCTACVDLLLAHHAKADASAVAWAHRTEQPELVARLVAAGARDVALPPRPSPPAAADAIARALPLLQRANQAWFDAGACTSCHHLPMALRSVALAQRLGFEVDRDLARNVIDRFHGDDAHFAGLARQAGSDPVAVLQASMDPAGDGAFGNAWFLAAEVDAGLPRGADQQLLASVQARMQQPDGRWRAGPLRGVIEWSDVEATALAIHAIAGYGDDTAQRALPAAARWLDQQPPPLAIVDHVALLHAWHDLGRDTSKHVATLRALQHADGSWSHLPGPGDAYSTGLVAVALIEAGGVAPDDPAIARAVDYLLRHQEPDGSWLVPSRAPQLLRYEDHGFPHGKLQFISYAGTAWAAMAVMYATAARSPARPAAPGS